MSLFTRLHKEGLISDSSFEKIKLEAGSRLFSLHWELKSILYLGVVLLTGGLGILIYKNIDSIGHQVILAAIGLLCIGCFYYCERTKLPFSTGQVLAPNTFFDYILLLGCLTLVTFITYLQVQYTAFGNAYGLAAFIPMVLLFFTAYYFDHLGILCMAITNLAAWMGIAVTPLTILKGGNFGNTQLIFAGLALGVFLIAVARASELRKVKAHFSFTYMNFGMNIFFISCLAGMFHFDRVYLLWILPLTAAVFYFYRKAVASGSFYLILAISLYSYIAISYVVTNLLFDNINEPYGMNGYMLALLYFIASGVFVIIFLIKMNKKLKRNDSMEPSIS